MPRTCQLCDSKISADHHFYIADTTGGPVGYFCDVTCWLFLKDWLAFMAAT